jgi:hypothetical protein
MAVEGEGGLNPMAAHQSKRNAIGKADVLIRVLPHPFQRFDFVFADRGKHIDDARGIKISHSFDGVAISGESAKSGRKFVDYMVARKHGTIQSRPDPYSLCMVLIRIVVQAEKRAGIDEYQGSSPYK